MKKRIVFIGPHFGELILKKDILKTNILESLWTSCSQINSEMKFNKFINQLKMIEEKNDYYHENIQFLSLINNLEKEFDYASVRDLNERLMLFKKILCKSMLDQSEQLDNRIHELLGLYLSRNEYIFSYNFDLLIENLMSIRSEVIVYNDRQSFLKSGDELKAPILYKLYGSSNQVDKIVMTKEEKQESIINVRMAISKINQFEDISVSLIGFNEEDKEFEDILNELALRNRKTNISVFELRTQKQEKKKYSVNHKTGLTIEVSMSDLQLYLLEQLEENSCDIERKTYQKDLDNNLNQYEGQQQDSSDEIVITTRSRRKETSGNINIIQKIPYKRVMTFIALLFCVITLNFFFSLAIINGESMSPNFSSSDYIVLNKQYSKVKRFDVIAFNSPDEIGQEYIKRVIGLPGDSIEYSNDQLYINGNVVEESYLVREKKKLGKDEIFTKDFSLEDLTGLKEVPQNKLFVLGDNRLYSRDSRNFGFIDFKDIKGGVQFKIWPLK